MILDLSFWQMFLRATAAIVVVTVHGYVFVALLAALGDRGPRLDGRLTLNPAAQFPLVAIVAAAIGRIAWVHPLTVEAENLRGGRWTIVVPILGATLLTLALVPVALALRGPVMAVLPPSVAIGAFAWLQALADVSVRIAVINLLPLPPFTAGYLLLALVPALAARIPPHAGKIGLAITGLVVVQAVMDWDGLLDPVVAIIIPG